MNEVATTSTVGARVPRVARSNDRVVAGVAAGWAQRWGVEPTVVRAAIGVLSLAGGIGIALYGVAALLSEAPAPGRSQPTADGPRSTRRALSIACAAAALVVAARSVGVWPGDALMLPAVAVALGIAVAWTIGEAPAARPWSWRVAQLVAGVTLLGGGVLSLASRTGGLANLGASAGAIAVVIGGLAMFAAPALGRLLRTLDDERSARIREDERTVVAAHLHDSVLQSLVLIQRSDDPRRMANLARRQERELRAWLYGATPIGVATTLHAAIEALTADIESDHDVRVEAVVVGDRPLDAPAQALVASVREAIVNAARHAGVDRIDVFVEADEAELTGFVRDTGIGFDAAEVPIDRRGIQESIVGRVERAGGSVNLASRRGAGTEVEIRLPVRGALR